MVSLGGTGGGGSAAGAWGHGSAPEDAPQGQPVVARQGWMLGGTVACTGGELSRGNTLQILGDAQSKSPPVLVLPLQLVLLYEEVLYTIKHRLGKPEHHHVADAQELYAYVQKVGPHLPNRVPKTCAPTCPPSWLKEMGSSWSELLTGVLKDVAVASSWRAGTACGWEISALGRNIYLRLGVVGRRLSLKSFQLVPSPSAGLFASLLSP